MNNGLRRVSQVAEQSRNHDYVLGETIPWRKYSSIIDPETGKIPAKLALAFLRSHVRDAKWRYYEPSENAGRPTILGYAYTRNNQRELAFLQETMAELSLDVKVINLCELPSYREVAVDKLLRSVFRDIWRDFFSTRQAVSPGLLHHLSKYATSTQAAYRTLQGATSRIFAVANDHSPAPVAYATVAEHFGMRVIYLQHSEVTEIFPPLDFDLTILRNRHSANIYKSIGDVRGSVIVAPRGQRRWTSRRTLHAEQLSLVRQHSVPVVIYPSSVVETKHLKTLVSSLVKNPYVYSLAIKGHPNARVALPATLGGAVKVLEAIPSEQHVAICGNSAISIELLERGNLVYQDFLLDKVRRDYYGFVKNGLLPELGEHDKRKFWADYPVLNTARYRQLATYLPRLVSSHNVADSLAVEPKLLEVLGAEVAGPDRLLDAWRQAWLYGDLMQAPRAALHSARTRLAWYADQEWVLSKLVELPDGVRTMLTPLLSLELHDCQSALDFWLIAERVSLGGSVDESLRREVVEYAATFRRSHRLNHWVQEQAGVIADRVD